jgi:hypothetical protein
LGLLENVKVNLASLSERSAGAQLAVELSKLEQGLMLRPAPNLGDA